MYFFFFFETKPVMYLKALFISNIRKQKYIYIWDIWYIMVVFTDTNLTTHYPFMID